MNDYLPIRLSFRKRVACILLRCLSIGSFAHAQKQSLKGAGYPILGSHTYKLPHFFCLLCSRNSQRSFPSKMAFVLGSMVFTLAIVGQVPLPTIPDNGPTAADPLGVPPHANTTGINESITLSNGAVNLYIPLLSLPQRGGGSFALGYVHRSNLNGFHQQIDVSPSLYNSGGQYFAIQHIDYYDRMGADDAPLVINLPRLQFSSEYLGDHPHYFASGQIASDTEVFCQTNFLFTDEAGNKHPFENLTGCGALYIATSQISNHNLTDSSDGSFYLLDTSNYADMKVTAKNGTVYHFYGNSDPCPTRATQECGGSSSQENLYDSRAGSIVDANGNQITTQTSYDGSGNATYTVTDTVGRVVTISPTGISYLDSTGTSQNISVTATPSANTTNYTYNNSCSYTGPTQYAPRVNPVVHNAISATGIPASTTITITFPLGNGGGSKTYSLLLDPINRISKMQYPAGGYTRYDYNDSYSAPATLLEPSNVECSGILSEVFHKYECSNASGSCSSEQTTTFNPTGQANAMPFNGTMSVTNPLGEKEVHTFAPASATRTNPQETDVQTYNSVGQLVQTLHKDYWPASSSAQNQIGYDGLLVYHITTTLNQTSPTLSTLTTYTYPSYTVSIPYPVAVSLDTPTEIDMTDYDGKVKRTITQQWEPTTAFSVPHMLDRLNYSTETDPATSLQSTNTYGYDTRGNVLQISKSGSTAATATSTYQRDSYGDITQIRDPMQVSGAHAGNTTVSYADQSISGCPTGSSGGLGLPTLIVNALGQTSKFAYWSSTGLLACSQDSNGNITHSHYDAIGRLIEVDHPDTGIARTTFVDSAPSSLATAGPTGITTKNTYDGFGRLSKTQLTSDSSVIDSTYDALGRVQSVSNSYRSTAELTYGITSFLYDALGRKTRQTQPDSTVLQWCYENQADAIAKQSNCAAKVSSKIGSWVDVSDEAGHHSQQVNDALGRMTAVIEPDPVTNLLAFETDYQYDGFDNLKQVDQWGGTAGTTAERQRLFTYDSSNHLITAYNPETGKVCYGTWSGGSVGIGSCQSGYDTNGNLLYKTDARGSTTQYQYDAMNRLTSKTAPGTNYTFTYDQGTNGIGRLTDASNSVNADEVFSYDSMGRMISEGSWTPSSPNNTGIVTKAKYDLAGNLTDFTYPDGRHITHSINGAGRPSNVVYADWNGTGVNYPYASTISYYSTGAVSQLTLGNGVIQTYSLNSRLQDCEIKATFPAVPGSSTTRPSFDKQYYFGSGSGNVCAAASGNNGNIANVKDVLNSGKTQSFQYDSLNRLTSAARSDNGFNYSYPMDSFGNMYQVNNLTGNPAISFPFLNNQMQVSGGAWTYDAAGNLTQTGQTAYGGSSFTFDSEGQLTQVNSGGTATYTYDAEGQRIRKDIPSNWTEYVYFGGQPIAEKNANGTWSDYIFANGQRIAEADSFDARIHLSGTTSSTGQYAAWYLPFSNYLVKTGDKIQWRQYQQGGARGGVGIAFTDGTNTNWNTLDSNGDVMNSDPTQNVWHERSVDLSSFANKTANLLFVVTDAQTPPGSWNSWFDDMAIISLNGTVTPIYHRQATSGFSYFTGGGISNPQAYVETSNSAGDAELPQLNTTYYAGDNLGTARMQFAAGGWPVWAGDFAPYGEEINAQQTTNHYKFTGKERDTESGLDYFGARYYASNMGRWMSPDWADKPEAVPYSSLANPQSLNLYGYVGNNPLSKADPDGHEGCCDGLGSFVAGALNAWGSDNLLGAGRVDQTSSAGMAGARLGDAAAAVQGVAEMVQGAAAVIGGGAEAILTSPASATGVGVLLPAAGGVAVVVGAAEAVHGTATAGTAISAMMKSSDVVTLSGQKADQYGNKLGGSGKPQQHETTSNTREGANNKALSEGSGSTNHSNPKTGQPHVHPTDAAGEKKPNSTHHNYPE